MVQTLNAANVIADESKVKINHPPHLLLVSVIFERYDLWCGYFGYFQGDFHHNFFFSFCWHTHTHIRLVIIC